MEIKGRVRYEVADGIGRIELSHADAGNALDLLMAHALRQAADRVLSDVSAGKVRVALIAARGKAFSVGGDLREFAGADDRAASVAATVRELHAALDSLQSLDIPTVSVVQGTAAGGALGLALACDVVLLSRGAKLVTAYTAAGLTPDCGVTWLLARRVSWARAMDLLLTNRVVSGEEAVAWGLASRLVEPSEIDAEVERVLSVLRAGSMTALSATKRLVREAAARDRSEQLRHEAATIARVIVEPDGVEGIDAFLQKRPPAFG
jgi:2-(1,2-epoxy-1,2-dihydrophenyl)acetyl-CoA isomerase